MLYKYEYMSQVAIQSKDNQQDKLYFTIVDVDVCVANALRRVVLSNIETLVFRGFPYESNHIQFKKNNTKFTNEYLKQRLTCLPIHVQDTSLFDTMIQKYKIVIEEENKDSEEKYVTSEHIKIVDKDTNQEISKEERRKCFPPNSITKDYVLICVLYPNFNNNEPNESIHIEATFDKGVAQENASWNVVHHCVYENVIDNSKVQEMINDIEDPVKKQDFLCLEAQKQFIPDQFKMSISSIGNFTNEQIICKACDYIYQRLSEIESILTSISSSEDPSNTIKLKSYDQFISESTNGLEQEENRDKIKNAYITPYIEDEYIVFRIREDDYTIGKLLEKYYFKKYESMVSFVGFKKNHPMQKEAYIYIKYKEMETPHSTILQHMNEVVKDLQDIFTVIKKEFDIIRAN